MACLSGINFTLGLPNRKQYSLIEEIQLINAGGMLSLIYHFSVFHEILDPGSGGEKNNWWELCTRSMDQAENTSNHWPVLISHREKPGEVSLPSAVSLRCGYCEQESNQRTSAVVHWPRLRVPREGLGSIPGQRARSWTPQPRVSMPQLKILHAATKIRDPACHSYDLVQSNK